MKKIKLWYSIRNGGDGSAYLDWFLTEKEAIKDQENMEDWGEPCYSSIDSYEGSHEHKEASREREMED